MELYKLSIRVIDKIKIYEEDVLNKQTNIMQKKLLKIKMSLLEGSNKNSNNNNGGSNNIIQISNNNKQFSNMEDVKYIDSLINQYGEEEEDDDKNKLIQLKNNIIHYNNSLIEKDSQNKQLNEKINYSQREFDEFNYNIKNKMNELVNEKDHHINKIKMDFDQENIILILIRIK